MNHPMLPRTLTALASVVLLVAAAALRADEALDADVAFLRLARVNTDGAGLLSFFRSRTLSEADRGRLGQFVRQLGDDAFAVRQQASSRLTRYGSPALPFLRDALRDSDREISRRAQFCIDDIERGPGASLPAAAARVLIDRKPAGAIPVLLAYLPFTDDESVEEEVLTAMVALAVQDGQVDPALLAALFDPLTPRRAAAAYVLARRGNDNQRDQVRKLLADADPWVRLRSAQGLVTARDKGAVPVLIALLGDPSLAISWQAEELLFRIAAEQAPSVPLGDGNPEARKKCQAAWMAWWQEHGSAVNLARLEDRQRQLGLTLIAELEVNKVWECGLDGKARWTLGNLQGPIDAQMLPGGRVLVAESQGQRVTERDLKGNIYWEKKLNQNPVACQRLPNGNTFIASYQNLMEVTRDGREVYSHSRGPGVFIFGAQKLRNGHILCISHQGAVTELDTRGKELKTVQITNNGGWCSVESLPGGHVLVALMGANRVAELDAGGKSVWECNSVQGPCAATRLPNGHTLVASMTGQRVIEVDRAGKTVWQRTTEGRPYRIHRR
jgi:HEAT repeat protein